MDIRGRYALERGTYLIPPLSTAPCHPRCPSNHFAPSLPSAAPCVDALLRTAVAKHDGKNWKSISMFLQGKSEVQVGFSPALRCALDKTS